MKKFKKHLVLFLIFVSIGTVFSQEKDKLTDQALLYKTGNQVVWLYIEEAGYFIDYDGDDNIIFDTREIPPLQFHMTMWKDSEAPHAVENLRKTISIRLIRSEMKN
ncbi:hypothetical protein LX77_03873 [Gelidibacter algens]|uniref:KTSC domain-containing protein n=1 Tax=Gelidibacter algens TaxID=49280 RepID=A0A1A7QPW0_9FLAO|nr:hypothetical protein [Gelidibacter algens]OBX22090.1 hypothetical protein A9996_17395 [Gelidibacter algens]RAJ17530.1 hypothetical protein LX77_03873 [Gelidibacter algens]